MRTSQYQVLLYVINMFNIFMVHWSVYYNHVTSKVIQLLDQDYTELEVAF